MAVGLADCALTGPQAVACMDGADEKTECSATDDFRPRTGIVLLFSVGKVRFSKTLLECESIQTCDLVHAFSRYLQGDWGDTNADQSLLNDVALATGEAATGVYRSSQGTEFWIQKDASGTHVILPVPQESGCTIGA